MPDTINSILQQHYSHKQEELLPILQQIHEQEGFLSEEAIVSVSHYLNIPTSKIYSVATFYDQFRFTPRGKFHIRICRGTACHIMGSGTILQELEKQLGIRNGESTRDNTFSIEVVSCIGACSMAPVIEINNNYYANLTPQKIKSILSNCTASSY